MTVDALPRPRRNWGATLRKLGGIAATAAGAVAQAVGVSNPPLARHFRDHAYSLLCIGFIDAAAYTHSLFSGLLVTGITFAVFEWKVSDG